MSEETSAPERSIGKTVRTIAVVLVAGLLLCLMIFSSTAQPSNTDKVWDEGTTLGNLEAKNYYIMYTDIACPYCDVFTRATIEHEEDFKNFLDEHDILFEVRMTDYLYESTGVQYSRDAAEAVYCARREGKFWEYYHAAVQTLWDDYQSKGYGSSKGAPAITGMPDDYWVQIGHKVGLGEEFDHCIANHEELEHLEKNTGKAEQVFMQGGTGLPLFVFNDFTTSGFDTNWGWEYVVQYLNAGLEKKK